jgi:hypothetical protein
MQMVEDPHDDGIVAGRLGDGDGLLGQGLPAVERTAVGKFRAQGGQDQRPAGMGGGQQVERSLQGVDLLLVGRAHRAVEPPVVGQGCGHEPVDIACSSGLTSGREERAAEARVPGLTL